MWVNNDSTVRRAASNCENSERTLFSLCFASAASASFGDAAQMNKSQTFASVK